MQPKSKHKFPKWEDVHKRFTASRKKTSGEPDVPAWKALKAQISGMGGGAKTVRTKRKV